MAFEKSRARPKGEPVANKNLRIHSQPDSRQNRPQTGANSDADPGLGIFKEREPAEIQVDFAELDDGSLVELVEDPGDPLRTLLAVNTNGGIRYATSVAHRGKTLVPLPRSSEGLAAIRLPRGVKPYNSVQELTTCLFNFIPYAVAMGDLYRAVAASFVPYTWIADRLPTAVYLSVLGLPGSGKTTLLELLSLLCRRPFLVSDITPAATCEACSRFHHTLLIDENEWTTARSSRLRRQQLRAGTNRSLVAKTLQQTGHSFGPKVLSSLEPPDDPALNSRCIQIPMTEANNPDLLKPFDRRLIQCAENLQQQLLMLRFDLYKTVKPVVIAGAEKLRPRSRDLFSCLAAPFARDKEWCELLLGFFLEVHEPSNQEPLTPDKDAVLAALFCWIHFNRDGSFPTVGSFGEAVNIFLKKSRKGFALSDKKVASVLTALGFTNRQRTNQGWKIWLDTEARYRIHKLVKTYGNEFLNDPVLKPLMENCPMCKDTATLGQMPAASKDETR